MSVDEVRAVLRRVVSGERIASETERVLDQLLRPAAVSHEPVPFQQRFEHVTVMARGITVGTRRADIEKVFPQEDCGISSLRLTRYYADQKSWSRGRSTRQVGH